MICDIIVDLQSGDTGKGKVTHSLLNSGNYDLVLRYNGGSNAGHTIYHNNQKIVTHQVPAGVLYGIKSLIGPGCVVNVEKLEQEIDYLEEKGFIVRGNILVDNRCHIVTDLHLEEDNQDKKIGTTKQGIGPAYRDKYARTGTRIGTSGITSTKFSVVDCMEVYEMIERLDLFAEPRILAEGAQGFSLDIDWGDYPYVTSSHCTTGSVCLNGISPKRIGKIYGIAKVYETYVGEKQFGMSHPVHEQIQKIGQEFGATTGRPRKVGWINLDTISTAIKVNGVTNIIFNKLDVLKQAGVYGYIKNNQEFVTTDLEEFQTVLNQFKSTSLDVTFSYSPYEI